MKLSDKSSRFLHKLSIFFYSFIILATLIYFGKIGFSYYKMPFVDRFFHPSHNLLKPSGFIGHGLGIFGMLIIFIGLFSYMIRKRIRFFYNFGLLKYWLEFHIFMCTLGSVMIVYHTTFKFGGFVTIGFWSMVAVWVSGVFGRFIYILIPRARDGRELNLAEVVSMKNQLDEELMSKYNLDMSQLQSVRISKIDKQLAAIDISKTDIKQVNRIIKKEKRLTSRIKRLNLLHKLFQYWHFIHLPFALILVLVAIAHVGVELYFSYFWIF
jgi:hypothetical protein